MAARGDAKVTTDHEFIRDWVERRGGCPTAARRTRGTPVVQIDYRGTSGGRTLVPMGWDEFFDWFERNKLAFQYSGRGGSRAKFIDRASVITPRSARRR